MALLPSGFGSVGAYQIARSLRFNSADSAYLNRTPASAGNRRTWTWSGWVKRSGLSADLNIFSAGTLLNNWTELYYSASNILSFRSGTTSVTFQINTSAVFRDPSAWYHVIVALDTTQATDTNRIKIYINGIQQTTSFSAGTWPTQNSDLYWNNNTAQNIGRRSDASQYIDGYMTEVNFIDGQALTPSSFGETDAATGVWKPKKYTGTYGTNGFYLNFSDNSGTTSTTLGKDSSGNGNNWTPNNFSVTAGDGNDSLVDTPTPYGTDTGAGGEVRGNYATLNPLMTTTSNATITNGNLDVAPNSINYPMVYGTIGMSSGKWYWEYVLGSSNNSGRLLGIVKSTASIINFVGGDGNGWGYYGANGNKYTGGSGSSYGASYTNSDVVGVAFDADAGTLVFYKNGVSQGTAFTGLTSGPYFPAWSAGDAGQSGTTSMNFGQRPFAYTAPSGYKALCTQNLPTPTIGATASTQAGKYFNPVLYTGNGSTQSITGVGFQPDWTWIKERSSTSEHALFDAVRGVQKRIISNSTAAEDTSAQLLTAFNSDGFSVGTDGAVNENTITYVAWNWNAGGSNSTNTAGSITSTVRANQTAGFSIVTYTGNATSGATVGHGLGVAPSMMILKIRGSTGDWPVYHVSTGNKKALYLNLTNAQGGDFTGAWNNTTPSSTVFTLGNAVETNPSNTMVAYCFAPVASYSSFGSYTGNGNADGPFVFTNFQPKYVLIKCSSTTGNWVLWDTARNTYNVLGAELYPNLSNAESTATDLDILSNGFKIRNTTAAFNSNSATYIYAAFASYPFKYSLGF